MQTAAPERLLFAWLTGRGQPTRAKLGTQLRVFMARDVDDCSRPRGHVVKDLKGVDAAAAHIALAVGDLMCIAPLVSWHLDSLTPYV